MEEGKEESPEMVIITNPTSNKSSKNKRPKEHEKFKSHYTLQEYHNLEILQRFDYRDKFGKAFAAQVAAKQGTNIHIHYQGLADKFNVWQNYAAQS